MKSKKLLLIILILLSFVQLAYALTGSIQPPRLIFRVDVTPPQTTTINGYFTVTNYNDNPINIDTSSEEGLAEIDQDDLSFSLDVDEQRQVDFTIQISQPGEYTEGISVLFSGQGMPISLSGEIIIHASQGSDAECQTDEDCDDLDSDYCDGDLIKNDEGKCVNSVCEVETTIVEDCGDYDDTHCLMDEVWEDDGCCVGAVCEVTSNIIEDCNDYDDVYCQGTKIWEDDGYCSGGACGMNSNILQDCDDGEYCNGQEGCENAQCTDGTAIDCSANDLPGIATCFNDPDNNPFTWDYATEFTSACDEVNDRCTTGQYDYTHACDKQQCGAECDDYNDCQDTNCDYLNGCYNNANYSCDSVPNGCLANCQCEENGCTNDPENDCQHIGTNVDGDSYDLDCGDCDDSDATIYPGAPEIACDGIDQDCNGFDYCGCIDVDEDGYDGYDLEQCPIGTDCNDNDADIHPTAEEILCDGIDQDCDGTDDEGTDNDGDGYKTEGDLCGEVDCNDNDATIYPEAPEIDDNIDQNCQNDAPVLSKIQDMIVNETDEVTINVSAKDTDGDTLYYYMNDSNFVQNNNIFTWQTPDGSAGIYSALIIVSDGELDLGVSGVMAGGGGGIPVLNDSQEVIITVNDVCTPDWQCIGYDACETNDRKECTQTNDTNDCYAQTNLPSDQYSGDYSELLGFCDYDDNGIIGKENETTTNIENLTIVIGNSTDLTQNFTGQLKVEFKEGNKTVVEFEFNFSEETLNLANITIETQEANATNGGVIISGVDLTSQGETKTFFVDRLSEEDYICIRDEEVASIDELPPADCSGGIPVSCPGSSGAYTCSLVNGGTQFKVEGLSHSGVTESAYSPQSPRSSGGGGGGGGTPACTESWSCTTWSICLEGGIQTRTCTDKNNCGTTDNKPEEEKSCTYLSSTASTVAEVEETPEEEGIEEEITGLTAQPEIFEEEQESKGLLSVTGAFIGNTLSSRAGVISARILAVLIIAGIVSVVIFKKRETRQK